jgi:uncharacterized DUF497 family protein
MEDSVVYRILRDQWFLEWFLDWDGGFEWDKGNSYKLAKHGLTVVAVEEFFNRTTVIHGKIEEPSESSWNEDRFLITQRTVNDGKCFSIIVTVREERLRVITCRRSWPEEETRHESRS